MTEFKDGAVVQRGRAARKNATDQHEPPRRHGADTPVHCPRDGYFFVGVLVA